MSLSGESRCSGNGTQPWVYLWFDPYRHDGLGPHHNLLTFLKVEHAQVQPPLSLHQHRARVAVMVAGERHIRRYLYHSRRCLSRQCPGVVGVEGSGRGARVCWAFVLLLHHTANVCEIFGTRGDISWHEHNLGTPRRRSCALKQRS